MVECHVRNVLLVTSDCLWYKVKEWMVRGWREGYEVVKVGRLPMLKITHTIFALIRDAMLLLLCPSLAHIFT